MENSESIIARCESVSLLNGLDSKPLSIRAYISGIYKIQSKSKPERIYIGSAINFKIRFNNHKSTLKNNIHRSIKLQRHYNKYGSDDLIYSILEYCDKCDLIKREQFYINLFNPWFNICKIAGSNIGYKHSKETRKKIGDANRNNRRNIGRIATIATRKKMSDAIKTKWQDREYRDKIIKANKNQIPWHKGRRGVYSEEVINKKIEMGKSFNTKRDKNGRFMSDECIKQDR